MFTAYAIDLHSADDTHAQCKTLDEALTHLRELITSEIKHAGEAGPDGTGEPKYDRYGISFDIHEVKPPPLADEGPFCPGYTTRRLLKKHGVSAEEVLEILVSVLWQQAYAVREGYKKPLPHAPTLLQMIVPWLSTRLKEAGDSVLKAIKDEPLREVVFVKHEAKAIGMLRDIMQAAMDAEDLEAADGDEEDED